MSDFQQSHDAESETSVTTEAKGSFNDVPEQIKKQLMDLTNKWEALGSVEKQIKRIQDKEDRLIQTVAIFVSLFTFISVNVNIFQKITTLSQGIWFMMLMTACTLIIFSLLLPLLNSDEEKRNIFKTNYIFIFWGGLTLLIIYLTLLLIFGEIKF